ncbi:hypothetical protein BDV10DRAFT_107311 [Aspergillus recurvatus]
MLIISRLNLILFLSIPSTILVKICFPFCLLSRPVRLKRVFGRDIRLRYLILISNDFDSTRPFESCFHFVLLLFLPEGPLPCPALSLFFSFVSIYLSVHQTWHCF